MRFAPIDPSEQLSRQMELLRSSALGTAAALVAIALIWIAGLRRWGHLWQKVIVVLMVVATLAIALAAAWWIMAGGAHNALPMFTLDDHGRPCSYGYRPSPCWLL